MKATKKSNTLAAFLMLAAVSAPGQTSGVQWRQIAEGGGTSAGGPYSISATIGQVGASGLIAGGPYSLAGGFWGFITLLQTPGLPNLAISYSGNAATVSWPNTGNYILQQTSSLASSFGWTTSLHAIVVLNGTNSVSINPPVGSVFFRLAKQ